MSPELRTITSELERVEGLERYLGIELSRLERFGVAGMVPSICCVVRESLPSKVHDQALQEISAQWPSSSRQRVSK